MKVIFKIELNKNIESELKRVVADMSRQLLRHSECNGLIVEIEKD